VVNIIYYNLGVVLMNVSTINKICKKEFIDPCNIIPLKKGEENENYLLKVKDEKHVLRILNKKRDKFLFGDQDILPRIEFEAGLMNKLHKDFPVPFIELMNMRGAKYYQIQPFLEGVHIAPNKINENQAIAIGETLAKLHNTTKSIKTSLKRMDLFSFEFEDKIIEKYESRIIEKLGKEKFEMLREKKEQLKKQLMKHVLDVSCITHNDFFYWNIKFKGDKISAILDFDESSPGNPLSDLATTLMEFSFYKKKYYPKNYFTILNAYKRIRFIPNTILIKPLMLHRQLYNIFYALFYSFKRKKKSEEIYLKKIERGVKKIKLIEGIDVEKY
jgi:Ser/Thr protein kinase RdoA (MazF antagonist)